MENTEQGREHVITERWIDAHRTIKGGFTKRQLEILGVAWPPLSGWKSVVVGQAISAEEAAEFERLSGKRSAS